MVGGESQRREGNIALGTVAGGSSISKDTRGVPDAQVSLSQIQGSIYTGWEKGNLMILQVLCSWPNNLLAGKVMLSHVDQIPGSQHASECWQAGGSARIALLPAKVMESRLYFKKWQMR